MCLYVHFRVVGISLNVKSVIDELDSLIDKAQGGKKYSAQDNEEENVDFPSGTLWKIFHNVDCVLSTAALFNETKITILSHREIYWF